MISLYKEKSAVAVFWLIIICFALHVNLLVDAPPIVASPLDGFLYYFVHSLVNARPYLVSLLYVLMIFLLALQISFVLNTLRMYQKQSYTAALAFLLFSALIPQFNVVGPALFACNLFIWILYSACRLYASPQPKTSIYNFGLLTGLCVVLYYPSVPLIVITLLALAIIRPFHLNEWFVLFFGMITPVYFVATYFFIAGRLHELPTLQQVFRLIRLPVPQLMVIVSLAVAALATLWGILSVQGAGTNVLIQVRKSWSVFLVSLLFFVPVIFFVTGAYPGVLLLMAIPAACYTGFAFAGSRNILPVIFFWVLTGLSVYNNWFAK